MQNVVKTIHVLPLMAALAVAGCNDRTGWETPETLSTRAEAGTVLVSVNAIAPWDQVAGAMQPTFAMANGDAALAKVAPRTQRLVEQTLKAFGFSLGVGLPQSFTSGIDTTTTNLTNTAGYNAATTYARNRNTSDGDTAASVNRGVTADSARSQELTSSQETSTTNTRQPGEVPDAPSGLPAEANSLTAAAVAGDIGIDPFLQYKAAAALYQEVQMLSREVDFAAKRRCYAPYLVRLQLAAIPYRRNVGYDMHTKIAFFHGEGDTPPVITAKSVDKTGTCLHATTPYVVPILATDNLERAVNSRASEVARQIGLAVNFMVNGIGGNVGANAADQSIKAILADDINSLMTVSRLTDNSLYVRIGASQQAATQHALVGRTYDVSLLLLVPIGFFNDVDTVTAAYRTVPTQPQDRAPRAHAPVRISMVSRNDYRKVDDGAVLAGPTPLQTLARYDQAISPILSPSTDWKCASEDKKRQLILNLRPALHRSDFAEFHATLKVSLPALGNACSNGSADLADSESTVKFLWLAMVQAEADNPYKTASFELPVPSTIRIKDQIVLLREYAKGDLQAVLRDADGITLDDLTVRLSPDSGDLEAGFPAEGIAIDPTTRTVSLTFPPLADFGVKAEELKTFKLRIEPQPCAVNLWPLCRDYEVPDAFTVRHAKLPKPDPKPGLGLRIPETEIVLAKDATTGSVELFIDKLTDDEAVIAVKGALIDKASGQPKPQSTDKQQVTVTKPSFVKLELKNLRVGKAVTITATGMKQQTDSKTGAPKKEATGKASDTLNVVKAE